MQLMSQRLRSSQINHMAAGATVALLLTTKCGTAGIPCVVVAAGAWVTQVGIAMLYDLPLVHPHPASLPPLAIVSR